MPEAFWSSLWNPESYLKFLILIFSYPIWGPILKIMWEELQEALAPEGGLYGKREKREFRIRPPGLDPWVNVPLASYRQRIGGVPTQRPTGAGPASANRSTGRGGGTIQRSTPGAAAARPAAKAGARRRGF